MFKFGIKPIKSKKKLEKIKKRPKTIKKSKKKGFKPKSMKITGKISRKAMPEKTILFRIHGRSEDVDIMLRVLGKTGFLSGFHVQELKHSGGCLPSEPATGYVKVSSEEIIDTSLVNEPDFLIGLDPSIPGMFNGLKDESVVILNSEEIPRQLKGKKAKCYLINGTKIASDKIGKPSAAGIVLLGALTKVCPISFNSLKKVLEGDKDAEIVAEEGSKTIK